MSRNRVKIALCALTTLSFSTLGVNCGGETGPGGAAVSSFVSPGSELMFNPQPDPPAGLSPGGELMLNPQPDPPAGLSPVGDRMFNPQPEGRP